MSNAVSNYQSSLALTEAVVAEGVFPSRDGGTAEGDYLGMIATYAFDFVPEGGLYDASGITLPIDENDALFNLLGTTYGGNGTSNFDMPDLGGATMIGAGDGAGLPSATLGGLMGAASTTLTPAELPSQYGGASAPFSNYQPSLPITYAIAINGVFPSPDSGAPATDMLGAVDAFTGDFAPGGFLACDGQLLQIAQYDALFNIIGTIYGGNGTTDFALPNLEGRAIVGASAADPVGTVLGTADVTLTDAEMPTPGTTPQAIDNVEPSLAMNYLIALQGVFPSQGGASEPESEPFLGQIQAFAGEFVPGGWALCQGQLLPISAYDALFNLIGTTYGGNGTTNFALPNLQGSTIIGAGGSYSIGQLIGANQTTLTPEDIPTAVISGESSKSSGGDLISVGATVTFSLTMNENVTVSVTEGGAAPTLELNDAEVAAYSGPVGVAVDALNFTYTVTAGDNVGDLEATAFKPNGAKIDNEAGVAAELSGFTAINSGVTVDTTPPEITFASSVVIANFDASEDIVTFSGTDADSVGVAKVSIFANATDLGAATLDDNGTWSFTCTLGVGTYNEIQAVALDQAGNKGGASADFTLTVADDQVTQNYSDGAKVISTFDIVGQAFTEKAITYAANGEIVSKLYEGVTGEGSLTSFEYLYAGDSQIGTDEFYTGLTGEPYTAEEVEYDGAGREIRAAFSDVTGEPYSSYAYDYVGGVFSGSQFTYTTVPKGAAYSSYEVDYGYNDDFAGEKFFFTDIAGQGYTGEEVDFNANLDLSRVLLTGVEDQAYSSIELDYGAGVYEGYKAYYVISGQSYTNEEVDISASGQLEKAVYSGMTSTPYSSVEQDYSSGSLVDTIYGYTDVTGETYNAYQVMENASGNPLQETFDLNSGGHDLEAQTSGQTLTSLGNDKMTGDGATTFALNPIYGADTITNLTSADTVSMSSAEYANFAALLKAAVPLGADVVITASNHDTLTLKNMTLSTLAEMSSNFTFNA